MRTCTLELNWMTMRMTGLRVVRGVVIGASVGAIGGTIFGTLLTAVMFLLRVESYGVSEMASYLAVCGASAGILLGVSGGLLDTETTAESSEVNRNTIATPANRSANAEPNTNPVAAPTPNRLAALSRTERRTSSMAAIRSPLRN